MGWFEGLAGAATAMLPGVSTVAGGVVSNLINQNQQENEATRNQVNFDQTMDANIQRKVADAKKAGIHPLYALGASSPSPGQPIIMQDQIGPSISQMGQNMAQIMSKQQTGDEKLATSMQLNLLESQTNKEDAMAAYYNSEAMKNMQAGQSTLGPQPEVSGLVSPEGQAPNPPGMGIINVKPADVTSQSGGRPDLIAGKSRAGFEIRDMGKDFKMIMPVAEGESPMELWSEMSIYDKAGLINRNMEEFGPQWLDKFWDTMYAGKSKKQSYLDYKLSPKINQLLYGDESKYTKHKWKGGGQINPKTGRLEDIK